ncbi:hypothetical protein CW696_05990 [ANME-2 cluster archaeon]|nr:MAG: hypothetical protein CW696_05990 [ANME-2 cluster archaeon]
MTKIQVDIPDELLERIRHAFEIRVGSKIPIANRHLIQWCVEQYMRGIPETIERTLDTIEEMPETRGAHEETPYNPEDDIPIDEWMEMRRTENL